MTGIVHESHSNKSNILSKTRNTAKAWMAWTTGSSAAIVRGSFGFSSATWLEVGKTQLNFTRPQKSNYSIGFTKITQYGDGGDAVNTTGIGTASYYHRYSEQGGTQRDGFFRSVVHGQ